MATKNYPTRKSITLYDDEGEEMWNQLEEVIRSEFGANRAREGEVAAQAFAAYLGREGPLEGDSA